MTPLVLHGKAAAGRAALIDDGDWPQARRYRWHLWVAHGGYPRGPYVCTTVRAAGGGWAKLTLVRLLTGWPRVGYVNGDTLDLRRANLVEVTHAEHAKGPHRRHREAA